MAITYTSSTSDSLRELFITGLRNAHALENQALSIMKPQLARIESYPEGADRLRSHIEETNGQIERLDEILAQFETSGSALKDAGLSLSGSMAALGHSLAGDEILKNSFANYAFEHFEIASYKSLLVLAQDGSFTQATPLLQQTLREEEAMAEWTDESLPMVTRRYAELYAKGGSMAAKV